MFRLDDEQLRIEHASAYKRRLMRENATRRFKGDNLRFLECSSRSAIAERKEEFLSVYAQTCCGE